MVFLYIHQGEVWDFWLPEVWAQFVIWPKMSFCLCKVWIRTLTIPSLKSCKACYHGLALLIGLGCSSLLFVTVGWHPTHCMPPFLRLLPVTESNMYFCFYTFLMSVRHEFHVKLDFRVGLWIVCYFSVIMSFSFVNLSLVYQVEKYVSNLTV